MGPALRRGDSIANVPADRVRRERWILREKDRRRGVGQTCGGAEHEPKERGDMAKSKVGKRIRSFREEQELTLDDVAERTGLEVAFLQALEEDEVYPSLGPLLKVARALGTRLGTFLDDQISEDPLIVRQTERAEELSMLTGKDKPVSLRFHSLGKGKSDRNMEPFYVEIYPDSEPQGLSSHEGEEFIVVVKGEVELVYGENRYVLGPGDSMYYNSIVPHHVGAAGDEKAEIYAVLYFPE
mgnify:FL=1